ncbi:MAG TPA: glycogen synthase [Anaerolineae bacterium]|nr:glycogen synthase [Anaerolineae bacterium]
MKILFLAVECAPFYKVGGLADVVGSLPRALRDRGHDVRVALPRYKPIDGARYGLKRTGRPFTAYAGNEARRTEMLYSNASGVPTYFVWDERFFNRDMVYGQPDEVMAFAFFVRATLEYLRLDDWLPDVIHAHDWHAALAPVWLDLLGRREARFANVASVFTIHNLAYQGITGDAIWTFAGLPERHTHLDCEQPGTINWMARAIWHADAINAVSARYAREIMRPKYGAGLDALLRERKERVSGILNGIDLEAWNPATDAALAARYTAESLERRVRNKHALQRAVHLPRSVAPLIGMVTRLVEQKGFDLLLQAADALLARDVQLVMLGSGDPQIEAAMQALVKRCPKQVALALRFDEDLARLIYGGSDIFLMPSRYEPSGLGQMIAMRYGSIPVVRATGGLADSVIDVTRHRETGAGFTFTPYTPGALLDAIGRALKAYRSARAWRAIQLRAMATDFSWARSARQYERLYRRAIQFHNR